MIAIVLAALLCAAALPGCRPVEAPSAPATDAEPEPLQVPVDLDAPTPYLAYVERDDLTAYATALAVGHWWQETGWGTNRDDLRIYDVDIRSVERTDDALFVGRAVFVLMAEVSSSDWHLDEDVLLVLEPNYTYEDRQEDLYSFEPLLVVSGRHLTWQVIDLGMGAPRPAIMVQEVTGGNGFELTKTWLYLATAGEYRRRLREVFREVTEHTHVPWGEACWSETSIDLRDGDGELKEIVISAHVEKWHGHPDWHADDPEAETEDYYREVDERRTWVFRWDGERYAGEIDLPGEEPLPDWLE